MHFQCLVDTWGALKCIKKNKNVIKCQTPKYLQQQEPSVSGGLKGNK